MSFEKLPKPLYGEIFPYLDIRSFLRCKGASKEIQRRIEEFVNINSGVKRFFYFLKEVRSSDKNKVALDVKSIFIYQLDPYFIVDSEESLREKINNFVKDNIVKSFNSTIMFNIYFPGVQSIDLHCEEPQCAGKIRIKNQKRSLDGTFKEEGKEHRAKISLFFLSKFDAVSSVKSTTEEITNPINGYSTRISIDSSLQTPSDDIAVQDEYEEAYDLVNKIHPIIDELVRGIKNVSVELLNIPK